MRTLSFDPLIPPSLWAALAVAAVGMLIVYAVRPRVASRVRWVIITALTSVGVALVLAILLNPTWVRELPSQSGRPLLTVLVDSTKSMSTADSPGGPTRYDAAIKLAQKLGDSLGEKFDLRIRSFGEAVSDVDFKQLSNRKPTASQTDLTAAIAGSLEYDRAAGQAVTLLSDGIDNVNASNQILAAARLAKAVGAPIYAKTFGSDTGGVDLGIDLKPPQDLVFIGQRVPVTAMVSHVGLTGSHADVTLLKDAVEVDHQRVELTNDAPAEARFWVRQEKTGVYTYEVRVNPVPGEVTQANNSATYLLRVIDEPVRVLMVEGKPYWDSKFLARTLGSVPAVELDSVVALTEGRLMRRTLSRPATTQASGSKNEKWQIITDATAVLGNAEDLKRYQIIVIGRDADPFLTPAAISNLTQWITRQGGSLVCYRGSPTVAQNDSLQRLLPVRWSPTREERFHVQMTEQGRQMHWLVDNSASPGDSLAGLPSLATEQHIDKAKPLATVLAVAVGGADSRSSPAVVYQPYGTGRVVVIEGAGMWRWAFLPPQSQQSDQIYASLWQSLLRWLVSGGQLLPGQKMTLRADKVSFASTENATATLVVREGAESKVPTIELSSNGKPAKTFPGSAVGEAAGTWRFNFGKLPAGRYQAKVFGSTTGDSGAKTIFDVQSVGPEDLDLKPRPDLMARLASESGGAVLDGDDPAVVAQKFDQHWAKLHPPRFERAAAWDRGWVMAAVIAAWACAWAVRRSGGLV
jgi:hypothetical protein